MIDLYKKLLVNQVDDAGNNISAMSAKGIAGVGGDATSLAGASADNKEKRWKDSFEINPNVNPYGDGSAEIIDFAVIDEKGNLTTSLEKGKKFTIKSKVKFNKDLEDPIFTYTFKNIQGTAITGTNTMYEDVSTGGVKEGDVYVATFEQVMNLQGGEYLLSISCTGYTDGEFTAYNRLYDLLNITVISDKNTVGYYDMFSDAKIEKCN